MRAIEVTFALFLGVTGIIGCASSERLYQPTATPAFPSPIVNYSVADFSDVPLLASTADVSEKSSEPAVTPVRNPLAQSSATPPLSPFESIEAKSEHGSSEELSWQSSQSSHRASHPAPPRIPTDNRLLELLDQAFEKAIVEPAERRRLQFSKEVIDNARVQHFVRYYSSTGKTRFQELLARSGKYIPMIAKVLSQEGLPEELGYLALLESKFIATNISRAGAVGLWQFVASTARQYGLRIDEWIDERRDPVKSTRAAARYLKDLHDYYGRWYFAAAAYNAGPTIVDRALQQSGAKDFWSIKRKSQLSEETRNFVPKFVAIALIAMDPKKYRFDDIGYHLPLDYDEVELKAPMTLAAIARTAETDLMTLRALNPSLLRDTTPPGESGFRANLPVGKSATFLAAADGKPAEKITEPVGVVTHEVKKGETLFSIARRYGLEVGALMNLNGLSTARLRIGQRLMIFLQEFRGTLR